MESKARINGRTFYQFMQSVDHYLECEVGLCNLDLADREYWEEFISGQSPSLTARLALNDSGYYEY